MNITSHNSTDRLDNLAFFCRLVKNGFKNIDMRKFKDLRSYKKKDNILILHNDCFCIRVVLLIYGNRYAYYDPMALPMFNECKEYVNGLEEIVIRGYNDDNRIYMPHSSSWYSKETDDLLIRFIENLEMNKKKYIWGTLHS